MKSSRQPPRPPSRRPPRLGTVVTRAFVWVVLAIFVLTSVGVALVAVR